jgi:hypothetical protein
LIKEARHSEPPGGPFLADTLAILRAYLGGAAGPGFDQDWQSYGNYGVKVAGIRVLSTNTNFFSIHRRGNRPMGFGHSSCLRTAQKTASFLKICPPATDKQLVQPDKFNTKIGPISLSANGR